MHRIDTSGAVASKFQDGNPGLGQLATLVDAAILNAFQEEISGVIEYAGIALNKASWIQLRQAIIAIAAGAAGSGGGSVPTTRQVNGGGLVTGGGALAADLTLSVAAASAAEVLAASITNKAVTPGALGTAFPKSLAASGYLTLPFGGGMLLQWLTATISGNATPVLSWPTSFPTACWGAIVNGGRLDYGANDNGPFASGWGTGNVSVFNAVDVATPVFVVGFGN